MNDFSTRDDGLLYSAAADPLMWTSLPMGREPSTSSSPISPLTPTKTEDLSGFLFPGEEEPTHNSKKHHQQPQPPQQQQRRRPKSFQNNNTNSNMNNNHLNTNNHNNNNNTDLGHGGGGKSTSSVEIRRQIHIQSEQKRRAQIKDGFEELRNQLPACLNKKMSKVALLHRTVQHIQHLKNTQVSILAELERLVQENEQLRKFQASITLQQDPSSLYTTTTTAPPPVPNTSTTTTTASPLSLSSSITTAPIGAQLYRDS